MGREQSSKSPQSGAGQRIIVIFDSVYVRFYVRSAG